MGWVSGIAVYFIIWWTTLFVVLPLGLQSQQEAGERALGTAESAPVNARMGFKVLLTTVLATVVFAIFYLVTQVWGIGPDDLPHFIPGT
ncbi:DUF1467 family protein [Jiella sonneratiae]|uniref:DUF1467 family protein n=1 Tax=Jiella sonneratiae TaxID=2816856 RepID=A0ABS3IXP6_9HYPH|nr:DUF1467 family protein [Jiella sonneratiae]MBO0902175.1 DUF1467 family protein [Jiella sonneratiae]